MHIVVIIMKSIKDVLKKYLPDYVVQFIKILRRPYVHARNYVKLRRIIMLAEKYRPYYQDELSQRILTDFERFKLTHDNAIFTDLAEELGWKYHDLNYHSIAEDKFSGIAIVHDGIDAGRYIHSLLSMSNWRDRHRFITLKEFLDGEAVDSTELIVPVLRSRRNREKFFRYAEYNNMFYTHRIYCKGLYATRDDIQYFDVFSPSDNEVIVDAGCYDGATPLQFLDWGGG